jgi:hypothetical protein
VDTLHIEWRDFSNIEKPVIKGYQLREISKDTALRHTIYHLDHPLLPGAVVEAKVRGTMAYAGFTNGDPQKELTFNGSFLSRDFLPYFGYDDRRELKLNQYRAQYGLQKLDSRIPAATNVIASHQLFASTQANRIPYALHISTSIDQRIVAPGKLQKEWTDGARRYYQFRSEKPEAFNFHILSAAYDIKTEKVNIAGQPITIEVYHHPGHAYNIRYLISSATEALGFLHGILGTYPYLTLRIAERPRYDEDLFAYGNVMVLPENHGWIADIRKKEDMDYLRYLTAKLVAEQYMQQANVSRTQGYPVITQSIPGYLAMMQLEHFYGTASLTGHQHGTCFAV